MAAGRNAELAYDRFGPAKVIEVYQPAAALRAFLVIDNVALGAAIGGLRIAPDAGAEECFRLARAMTLKNALAGLPHGGGKSLLRGDPHMPAAQKQALIRAFARALRNETDYIFGPDMGTDETAMAWVKDEIGRAVGLPAVLGGIPLDDLGATGWGVYHAAEAAAPHCGITIDGARVAVQGFGAVGMHAARFLAAKGARLVAASDSQGTVYDPTGMDVDALIAHKRLGHGVATFPGASARSREAIIGVACDIWIPAARPDVITEDNVGQLRVKLVVEGANIPLTAGAERILHERGVLVLPDFLANAGGVICAAAEYRGATPAAAFDAITEKIRSNTAAVLQTARTQSLTPREAAQALALARVERAMQTRRFAIY
jgi:glutamate dehydrogenase (NAD(P)+)